MSADLEIAAGGHAPRVGVRRNDRHARSGCCGVSVSHTDAGSGGHPVCRCRSPGPETTKAASGLPRAAFGTLHLESVKRGRLGADLLIAEPAIAGADGYENDLPCASTAIRRMGARRPHCF